MRVCCQCHTNSTKNDKVGIGILLRTLSIMALCASITQKDDLDRIIEYENKKRHSCTSQPCCPRMLLKPNFEQQRFHDAAFE